MGDAPSNRSHNLSGGLRDDYRERNKDKNQRSSVAQICDSSLIFGVIVLLRGLEQFF